MANGTAGKWGCGCLTAILIYYVGIPLIMAVCKFTADAIHDAKISYEERAEKRRVEKAAEEENKRRAEEQERGEAERKAIEAAQAKSRAEREDRLRSFTLKEAPVLWKAYQELEAQIVSQGKRIDDLRKTLTEFDKDPDQDADFRVICSMRDEMIGVKTSLRRKIEDAYLAYRKFEATPSRKEYDALRRKTLEDGIQEAESAARRFTIMRNEK